MSKICTACKIEKPYEAFAKRKTPAGRIYYRPVCRACFNAAFNAREKEKSKREKTRIWKEPEMKTYFLSPEELQYYRNLGKVGKSND